MEEMEEMEEMEGMEGMYAKSGCIYIIGCLLRPGTLSFATQLEYDYFPPDTDENDLYNIFRLQYCGAPYYIIEVPHHSHTVANALASKLGLKMVHGKPTSSDGPPFALLCGAESCFTLETVHDGDGGYGGSWSDQLRDEYATVQGHVLK